MNFYFAPRSVVRNLLPLRVTKIRTTDLSLRRERAHGLDALIHDVVSKPFTLSQIRNAVNGALRADDRRQTADGR
jgi:two-component system, cell cycle response regulator CpdR